MTQVPRVMLTINIIVEPGGRGGGEGGGGEGGRIQPTKGMHASLHLAGTVSHASSGW